MLLYIKLDDWIYRVRYGRLKFVCDFKYDGWVMPKKAVESDDYDQVLPEGEFDISLKGEDYKPNFKNKP